MEPLSRFKSDIVIFKHRGDKYLHVNLPRHIDNEGFLIQAKKGNNNTESIICSKENNPYYEDMMKEIKTFYGIKDEPISLDIDLERIREEVRIRQECFEQEIAEERNREYMEEPDEEIDNLDM